MKSGAKRSDRRARASSASAPGRIAAQPHALTTESLELPIAPRPLAMRAVKRAMDISLAVSFLLILSPLLALVAAAIELSSPGAVLYPWHVVGLGGRDFVGYKFRSMVSNADSLKPSLAPYNEMTGPVFKMQHDPRVTPLGRFLRRHSLDELPQLWSVLVGDMSLVGPRPPSRAELEQFEPWQWRKLSVKPGLTCLWQVNGRNRINDFAEWVRLDLEYIDNWSLWLDLKILLKTGLVVLGGTGV